ncbi:MAG: alpha/beta fold hydrolase [Pseudomonadota bacterium]
MTPYNSARFATEVDEPAPEWLSVPGSAGGQGDAPTRQIAMRLAAPGRQAGGHLGADDERDPVAIMWLPGFNSDMISTKASVLAQWAAAEGHGSVRFDYFAHGESEGDRGEGTIGIWTADALAVAGAALARFDALLATDRPVRVLPIGSSMGGWVALNLLRQARTAAPELANRICGLALLAPAWDMTERLMWAQFTDEIKAQIMSDGRWMRPSAYGDPYAITRALIDDGREHLFAGSGFAPGVPVRIIQGMRDPDVPAGEALALMDELATEDVQVTLIKDGEHRLSRPQDLDVLLREVSALLEMS